MTDTLPDFGPAADAAVKAACAEFPETFKLRAYPGDTFRLSESASFVSQGRVLLYTQRLVNGEWLDFAKGTADELRTHIVR